MAKKQETLEKRVMKVLNRQKREMINMKELAALAGVGSKEKEDFLGLIENMRTNGELYQRKFSVVLCKNIGLVKAEIISVLRNFGFAKPLTTKNPDEKPEDIFIPGRMMQGAMPGDVVLVKASRSKDPDKGPEGSVISIISVSDREFTGVLQRKNGMTAVLPDKSVRVPIEVSGGFLSGAKDGDKVLAKISTRGNEQFSHRAKILQVFGSADLAESCCKAVLASGKARLEFDEPTMSEAKSIAAKGISPQELLGRLDLTAIPIFTIDSADSKDLDDAVSLEKSGENWLLGIHIADVSHYVRPSSAVDKEAYERGTSVYYADQVIPMLPQELSNGICSLNPGEIRLTFSAFITMDTAGNILSSRFAKTYIKSRVKGIYKEINTILKGEADEEITAKYAELIPQIMNMNAFAKVLSAKRFARGAMNIDSTESKFIIEEGRVKDIVPRPGGVSEQIIEEFMLTANQAAATLAIDQELPFVFRIHDNPPATKLDNLHKMINALGLDGSKLSDKPEPKDLSAILEQARGTDLEDMVNAQLLRTMAKAIYSENNIGHFGLVLGKYAHFTSPIRRYPDLIIHRILSGFVNGDSKEAIQKHYGKYVPEAAKHCSDMEINAVTIERDCEACYKAEYMSHYIGQKFMGRISSVTSFGFYVTLPNTVEGLVHVRNMKGFFTLLDSMELVDQAAGTRYRIGQQLEIMVLSVSVSSGQIDFSLAL